MSVKLLIHCGSTPDDKGRREFFVTADGDVIYSDKFDPADAFKRKVFGEEAAKRIPGGGRESGDEDYIADQCLKAVDEFKIEQATGGSSAVNFGIVTAAELDAGDYRVEYAVDGIMVERQPLVILGAQKTLKTSLALDLALSLSMGGFFLGRFKVNRARRVLFMSGESGMGTIQETARRQCEAMGRKLIDAGGLFFSGIAPRITDVLHLAELRRQMQDREIETLFVDPLYLALDAGGNEASLFAMGAMLRGIAELCQAMGVTLVILHHTRKSNGVKGNQAPELADASWSGIAEFARQWLILHRHKPYKPGSGRHELNMAIGGSAGHSGFYTLTIDQGVGIENRRWEVTVEDGDELRDREAQEREQAEADRKQRLVDGHVADLRKALKEYPDGETERQLRSAAGLNGRNFHEAIEVLRGRGEAARCEVEKSGKSHPGWKPCDPWKRVGHSGTNNGFCPVVPVNGE